MKKNKKVLLFLYAVHLFFMSTSKIFAVTEKVNCGNITNIPKKIPELTNKAIVIVQVIIPVILVIMGSIDFYKSLTSQKEDEIKKGQQIFIKRLIMALLIFFVIAIVKFFVSIFASTNSSSIVDCMECFLRDVSNCK